MKVYYIDILDDISPDYDGHLLHNWLHHNMITYKVCDSPKYPRLAIIATMSIDQEVEMKLRWNVYAG